VTLIVVDMSVTACLCVVNFYAKYLGILETNKQFRGSCPIGSLWQSACGTSIYDVIDDVTWLWCHTCDVTVFI